MNIEDIKVGETYNVRVRVVRIDTNCIFCQPLNQDGTPSDFCPNYFKVVRGEQCVSIYPYGPHETRYYKKAEHAKAAAEAERDRLNAELRKEQK